MTLKPGSTFDDILDYLGPFGPYQIITTLLLCIPANVINAWTFYNLVFQLYAPDHKCTKWNTVNSTRLLGNYTDDCEIEDQKIDNHVMHCEAWKYDKEYIDQSLKTQWNLVCDHEPISRHVMAIFTAAGILGIGVMSVIQDRFGRRPAFFISLTFTVIGSGFSLLAPTFGAFVAIRSIQQTQFLASYTVPFVWAQEFVGPDKRTLVNVMMVISYACSTVSMGLIAWACRTWVQLGLVTSVPFVFLYSYVFLLDESPRWLLSVGRIKEAMKIVEKIAVKNGKASDLEAIKSQVQIIGEQAIREREEASKKNCLASLTELLKTSNLRKKLLLISVVWVANLAVYNTVAFNATKLANMYLAFIIQASVEAPACIFILLFSNRIGRMPPIILGMLFSMLFSFLCIPAFVWEWNEWCAIIFAALSKFGICVSANICLQNTGELYPTTSRATGTGINEVAAALFVAVIPYVLETSATEKWLPMCILGVMTFVGTCCACLLPETMDQPMPQTAIEAEQSSKVGLMNMKIHVKNLFGIRCKKVKQVQ